MDSNKPLGRRQVLQAGAALGLGSAIPWDARAEAGSSPDLEKFVQPLPIPDVREPDGRIDGVAHHEVELREFETKVHPDLPPTTLWGFDGQVPGPVIKSWRNVPLKITFDNSGLPEEHLFEIDDLVHGTEPSDYDDYDGPVPEVRTSVHQHGLRVEPESDGQAGMWKAPDGTTGPKFVKDVHDIPNRQKRTTTTYHDHALGISRLNNYAGLNGFYVIEDWWERWSGLPRGEYDIPIMLQDRSFESDGSLAYPDSFVPNVAGDTAFVNGAVWPYLEVEPRRYRFRLVNQSNGRTFDLSLQNEDGDGGHHPDVPTMYQFAPDHGYLDRVIGIGTHTDLRSLVLSPFERAELLVDFSEYAGETLRLVNHAEFPYAGGGDHHGGHGGRGEGEEGSPDLRDVMQIRVADSMDGQDTSVHAGQLDLSGHSMARSRTTDTSRTVDRTRHMTLGMEMREDEPNLHLLNGKTSFEGGEYATPELGSTEIWELENQGHHSHPIHLHLVDFRVIGRGPDGTEYPEQNEVGPKDVVRVDPGETVRIRVSFTDYTGEYMWHCHVLEHEEHAMMRPFEVVEPGEGD